uniref:Putative secreted protein n=1 Tax=Xenopsylla cheopis TaxID=163159 RepID=A0A6M2DVE4_XENCH
MLIKQKVAPATLLVLGNGISLTVANNLMRSDLNMNAVKTLDNIRCVENKDNPLSDIISLLLQRPSEVISLAREIPRSQLQQFLSMHLWYDNYTNINDINKNSLEVLLHQIAAIDYGADAESFDYTKPSIEIILNEDS